MEAAILLGFLGTLSIEDVRTKKLRTTVVLLMGIAGLILHLIYGRLSVIEMIQGMILGLILIMISLLTSGKIGMGDALLILVTGIYMGFWSTLLLLWLGSGMVGFYGLYMIWVKKKGKNYEVPFVPFLLIAYVGYLAVTGGILK